MDLNTRTQTHRLEGIDFLYCKVQLHIEELDGLKSAHSQQHGIHDNHCYVPIGLGTLQARQFSGDNSFFTATVSDADVNMADEDNVTQNSASAQNTVEPKSDCRERQHTYLVCIMDTGWGLAALLTDYKQDDLKIRFTVALPQLAAGQDENLLKEDIISLLGTYTSTAAF